MGRPALEEMVMPVLDPEGDGVRRSVLASALARYQGRTRAKDIPYLAYGLHEHRRITGCLPGRYAMAAWLYHDWEPGDEGISSVAFLRDCRSLGFSLEEAERHVVPLISGCWDLTGGASVVIDMELSLYGQPRVAYLRSARRTRDRWRHLGSRAWEEGRTLGLVMLVQKDPMFQSPEFERELAAAARANIKAELLLLGLDYERERAEADKAAAEAKEKKDEVPAQRPDSAPAGKQGEDTGPVPGGGEGGGEVRVPPGGKP
jgi:hypothetical protein